MDIRYNWYDREKGFQNTCPGWYEHHVNISDDSNYEDQSDAILYWLYNRMDNCERHARWVRQINQFSVKFRHERDYLWFKLSF